MDDKTVRGDDNFIPSQMNNDSTYRGDNQIISSGFNTPNVNAAANDSTVRFDDSGYSDYIGSGMTNPASVQQGVYVLNNKKYKFLKTISVTTGEADIILVEGNEGKAVLKIYRDRNKPKLDLIEQLRSIKHDDIIRVFDFGFIPDQFGEKFFELMEFAEGGSVLDNAPIGDEKKIKQILKETINAFKFLHEKGIVHCDIKPENLYYRNKNHTDIVIADFGISSIMDTRVKHHITTRKGSDFYIAPEGRQLASLRSNNVKISGAVDYYSLGVTLLVAWMGKEEFENKIMEIAGISDKTDYEKLFIAWNDLKEKGNIPFPDNMPERVKNLIRGLMVLTEDKRWGYDECTRWLKGEDVPVHKDVIYSDYEPFAFDDDKIAFNPEQLAEFMQQDLKMAEKYLFRGKIKAWLEKAKNVKLATIIDDIAEDEYSDDKKAAVQASIYALNKNLPYLAVDGTKCETITEIGTVIESNFDEYVELLQNRNDSLYLYIESKGYVDVADSVYSYYEDYEDNPQLATMYAMYHLNTDMPFYFYHPKDKNGNEYTEIQRDDLRRFASVFFTYMDKAKIVIESGELEAWLSFGDNDYYYDAIKYLREQVGPKNKDSMVVGAAYVFDDRYGYTATDRTDCKTKEDVAAAFMKNFDKYTGILKNDFTYFHMYAWAKKWDWELSQARHSFNFKNHKGKLFPYNEKIALMRVIRALGKEVAFEIEGVVFKNPNELANANSKVKDFVKKELKNLDSKIHAWISVFYHEDPFAKFSKKGDYEDKLKEYMDFIEKISPSNELTKRYLDAKNSIPKHIQKEKALDTRFFIGQGIAMALPVVMAYFLFMYVYPDGGNQFLPGKFWALPGWYYFIFGILGVIFTFAGGDSDLSTGCIGGPIVGAIVGIVLYYIFYFVVSSYYITGGLMLVLLGYALYDIFKNGNSYTSKAIQTKLFDMNDKLTFEWEPLAFAFSNKDKFESPRVSLLNDYHVRRRKDKIYILKRTVIPILVFFTVLMLLLSFDAKYDPYFTKVGEIIKSIVLWVKNLF